MAAHGFAREGATMSSTSRQQTQIQRAAGRFCPSKDSSPVVVIDGGGHGSDGIDVEGVGVGSLLHYNSSRRTSTVASSVAAPLVRG